MYDIYFWVKALHIISVISWMAGMFYLPRLFVYHTRAVPGGEADQMLKTMERKLIRIIINPAMVLTFIFGIWLIALGAADMKQGWLHAKILLVLIMAGLHGFFSVCRKNFEKGANTRSERFFRIFSEIPVVLTVVIVFLVVIKPF